MNGVSLIMATLHRVKEVEQFVECLRHQTNKNFELIVVDQNLDGRLQPIMAVARNMGIALTHIAQSEPNQCLARNTGLARATKDVVAFPDDDCWYEPDTIARVLNAMGSSRQPAAAVIRWVEQDPLGQPAHVLDNRLWRSFRGASASMITQFYRTDVCRNVGGFDQRLGLHSWFGAAEETDLMFRVLATQAQVEYLPDARVHHAYGFRPQPTILAAFRAAQARARGTGAIYAKHKLPKWVILRGFGAPWIRTVTQLHKPMMAASQLGTAIGRIQGYARWQQGANR